MDKHKMVYPHNGILFRSLEKVLIHVVTRPNLANFMLTKGYQSQKNIYSLIPFIWNDQNKQSNRDKKHIRCRLEVEEARGKEKQLLVDVGFL